MSENNEYEDSILRLAADDPRYSPEAYFFVQEAVQSTVREVAAVENGQHRHLRGRELLWGIRRLALQKFGALTLEVLNEWGVTCTADFGAIVFNMVNCKLLGATPEDSPADFAGIYDFQDVFMRPFKAPSGREPVDIEKIA